jgi:hypothetical protein
MKTPMLVIGLLTTECLINACHRSRQSNTALAVREAFNGFDYAGEFTADSFAPPEHDSKVAQIPDSLRPGVLYVFHRAQKVDEQELATKVLPGRLRSAGFTVLEAPSKLQDLAFVDPGGVVWKIRFRFDSQEGIIYNVLDKKRYYGRDATASTDTDDYVLKFDK